MDKYARVQTIGNNSTSRKVVGEDSKTKENKVEKRTMHLSRKRKRERYQVIRESASRDSPLLSPEGKRRGM